MSVDLGNEGVTFNVARYESGIHVAMWGDKLRGMCEAYGVTREQLERLKRDIEIVLSEVPHD